jgi:hypothetical protein
MLRNYHFDVWCWGISVRDMLITGRVKCRAVVTICKVVVGSGVETGSVDVVAVLFARGHCLLAGSGIRRRLKDTTGRYFGGGLGFCGVFVAGEQGHEFLK